MKIVIIGGVAGGMSAAARLRRLSETAEITVFEKGGYVSFANCGLPYYIGGEITERQNLLLQTPESFKARFNVNVRVNSEVLSVDTKAKEVRVKDLKTGNEYAEKYDKLLLSPGAEPVKPPIPGIDSKKIFTLRNMEDTDKIYTYIRDNNPKKVVVVGGGYIGLEIAENLKHKGMFVTIVEALPQVMGLIDFELAAMLHQHIKQKGIELYLNDGVKAFAEANNKIKTALNSGKEIESDFVMFSIGVKPDVTLAKQAGLAVGARGITVNEYMQTSDPDIYAVGDAVETVNPISGKKAAIALAGPANKQGRFAAENMLEGNKIKYRGTIGTGVIKVFDMTSASTGLNSRQLDADKIHYESVVIHPNNHAGYYPGGTQMLLKMMFSPSDGKIFGVQAVGYEGVEKRIDVAAAFIQKGGTIEDLLNFEHCYAPPFSSAKDPINMAGFIAENIIKGRVKQTTCAELINNNNSWYILDVRDREETDLGMIPNAVHIPLNELRKRLNEVPKDKKTAVYCRVGLRGYLACRILAQNGFNNVFNVAGGYITYSAITGKQSNENIFGEKQEMGSAKHQDRREENIPSRIISVNACGLQCPGPIMKLKTEIDAVRPGDRLEIKATDPGFYNDVSAWARSTGNKIFSLESDKGVISAVIEKAGEKTEVIKTMASHDKTMIVFSGDMDKIIASFIIANGALAMGRKMTMFFTFWGLNALKKPKQPGGLKKNLIEKAFGFMLPRGSKKLALSKMNMAGMGPLMIRGIMKKHNISSVEELIQAAIAGGARIVACQMTMDLMGIKKEELIDGVEIGGVASMLESSDGSDATFFI
ncbi:MAG TPA: FAD-dependent oxidoreductase [Candidatus Goldiibacteriota bacterium]|nr:FAD-dependent oxidoreductase [Candidatus Goldiibacteriota bacterium]